MTVRGRFFTRAEYQQHVYGALVDFPGFIKILPPAIVKPIPLWSGKQIISTIILNLVPKVIFETEKMLSQATRNSK
jgi:DNA-directed RNA polymerase I subunit RPA1